MPEQFKKEYLLDPLSDVLELLGFTSSIYFQKKFCGNWKMSVADTGFAQFHFIVRGTAVLEHNGQVEHLSAGDLVLFPKGAAHAIGDSLKSPAINGKDVIANMNTDDEPFREGQATTQMICGHFEYDFTHQHPLVTEFPPRMLLRTSQLEIGKLVSSLMQLIINETWSPKMGSRVVTQHLSQALFASILRAHFEQEDIKNGFYVGLHDKQIVLAISAIHEIDGWKYTLRDLASIAGMSRSSFATKFKAQVGQTPGDYALHWKIFNARQLLQKPGKTIDQVAQVYGYGSSSAFSRAFRSVLGISPSDVRKQ